MQFDDIPFTRASVSVWPLGLSDGSWWGFLQCSRTTEWGVGGHHGGRGGYKRAAEAFEAHWVLVYAPCVFDIRVILGEAGSGARCLAHVLASFTGCSTEEPRRIAEGRGPRGSVPLSLLPESETSNRSTYS